MNKMKAIILGVTILAIIGCSNSTPIVSPVPSPSSSTAKNGKQIEWNKSWGIKSEGEYKDGNKIGDWVYWDSKNNKILEVKYDNNSNPTNPKRRYSFEIPNEFKIDDFTPQENKWRSSLIENLKYQGKYETYKRTNLEVFDWEISQKNIVYVNINNPQEYYIKMSDSFIIIDFKMKAIGMAGGGGGTSFHETPSGEMVVCLLSGGYTLSLQLLNKIGECDNVIFSDKSVKWASNILGK